MNGRPRHSAARQSLKQPAANLSRRHKGDHWLLVLTALLLTIGLVVVYSISPGLAAARHMSQNYFISKQLIDVVLGAAAFAAAAHFPASWWEKVAKPLLVLAVVGSFIVMVTPVDATYQAHRWIRFGGFSFQIAELIKLALLVWASGFLTTQWRKGQLADFNATIKPLLIVLLAIGVVVAKFQSDLGSAGVMVAMLGLMAFTVGVPLRKIALISLAVVMLAAIAIASSSYRRERLATFFHPQSNCQGSGYQACQALISVGSGGLSGLGLGYSVQAYGYLPEASNDSIFAIIAEKFGFIGSVAIVVVYAVFFGRLKRIVERTADQFARLLVVGVLAWLSTQMFINVGAMIGLLPLKGITLPLISQGGTSLIFLTAALGMVFNISRYTSYDVTVPKLAPYKPQYANSSLNGRGVRRPYNPALTARPRT